MSEKLTPISPQAAEIAEAESHTRVELQNLRQQVDKQAQIPLREIGNRQIGGWQETVFALNSNTQINYGFSSKLGTIAMKPLDTHIPTVQGLPNKENGTYEFIIERLPSNKVRVLTYRTFTGSLDIVTTEGSVHIDTHQPKIKKPNETGVVNNENNTQISATSEQPTDTSKEPIAKTATPRSVIHNSPETKEEKPLLEYTAQNINGWHERTFTLPAGTEIQYQCQSSVEKSPVRTMKSNIAEHSGLYNQFIIERLPGNSMRVLTSRAFQGTLDIYTPHGTMRIDSTDLRDSKKIPKSPVVKEKSISDLLHTEQEVQKRLQDQLRSAKETLQKHMQNMKAQKESLRNHPKLPQLQFVVQRLSAQLEQLKQQANESKQRIDTLKHQADIQNATLTGIDGNK